MKIRQNKPIDKKGSNYNPFGDISQIHLENDNKAWSNSTEIKTEKIKSNNLHAILQPTKMKRSGINKIKPILKKISISRLKDTLKGVLHKKKETLSKIKSTSDENDCKQTSFESKPDLTKEITSNKQSESRKYFVSELEINTEPKRNESQPEKSDWEKTYIKKAEELAEYHDLTPFLDSFMFDMPTGSSTQLTKTKRTISLVNPVVNTITLSSEEESKQTSVWEASSMNHENGSTIYLTSDDGDSNCTYTIADSSNDKSLI